MQRGLLVSSILAGSLMSIAGCTDADLALLDSAQQEQAVIYGVDDRREYYEVDGTTQAWARATTTLVSAGSLNTSNANDVRYQGYSLQQSQGLCSDERFVNQPTASGCSASLIDDRLVMTAGHCVFSNQCPNQYFGFGYYYDNPGSLAQVSTSDFYSCSRVVAYSNGSGGDYAVLELDRDVDYADPIEVDTSGVSYGDDLILMGHPSGLPLKIAGGGQVVSGSAGSSFQGTVDAFGGNSGSVVLGADGRAVGILVAGAQDYAYDQSSGCYRVNELPQSGAGGGETITDIRTVVNAVCASGYPSERLCGTAGTCGDGFCSGGETADTCEADCAGNGQAPSGWTCNPDWYAAGDDCDCGCGVVDPDCQNPNLGVYGCQDGQTCSDDGVCIGAGQQPNPEPNEPDPSPSVSTGVPDDWTCNPGWYGVGDDCDCDCGAVDPDCQDTSLDVYNCEEGEVCSSNGACIAPGSEPETGPGITPGTDDEPGNGLGGLNDDPDEEPPVCSARHTPSTATPLASLFLLLGAGLQLRRRRR